MTARTVLTIFACLCVGMTAAAQPSSVTFGSVPARVGEVAEQSIRSDLRLKARVRRGAEVLNESESNKVRSHDRVVTTIEVAAGRRVGVKVAYSQATDKVIAGKTYLCRRDGDALRIEDEHGKIPTPAEFAIVAQHMERLGKPNPLAAFLQGKTVAINETIEVPADVAVVLFGPEQFSGADRFQLKLTKIDDTPGGLLATFVADIRVAATDGTQTRIEIGGPMVVEPATGRVASIKLVGPIAMNQSRHDPGGLLQVSATGRLTFTMTSRVRPSRVALRPLDGARRRF